jgi:hypothetical protein
LLRNLKKLKTDRSARDDIAKKVTLNGDEWVKLLDEGKGPPGAVGPMMMMMMFGITS